MKLQYFHFHHELIAGDNSATKTDFVETGEHEETARARPRFAESENRARLRERLDDEDAGHHRMLREMPGEERLVEGYVLEGDDAALFELENSIDEQERIAMGEEPQHSGQLGDFGVVRLFH